MATTSSKKLKNIEANMASKETQTPGVLPPPRTLTDSDRDIIIAEVNAWNREFSKRVENIEIYRS